MIKLRWGLPGDFTGGFMIFGIMFTIAVIEMYALKAFQTQNVGTGVTTSLKGGGGSGVGGAGGKSSRGAKFLQCIRQGGTRVGCEELVAER